MLKVIIVCKDNKQLVVYFECYAPKSPLGRYLLIFFKFVAVPLVNNWVDKVWRAVIVIRNGEKSFPLYLKKRKFSCIVGCNTLERDKLASVPLENGRILGVGVIIVTGNGQVMVIGNTEILQVTRCISVYGLVEKE